MKYKCQGCLKEYIEEHTICPECGDYVFGIVKKDYYDENNMRFLKLVKSVLER